MIYNFIILRLLLRIDYYFYIIYQTHDIIRIKQKKIFLHTCADFDINNTSLFKNSYILINIKL
jgi:hypothetical protein